MGWFYVREVACTSGESENEKFSSSSIFLSPSTSPPRRDNLHSIEHCLTNSCSSICLRFFFSSSCPGKAAAVAPFCSFFRQPPAPPYSSTWLEKVALPEESHPGPHRRTCQQQCRSPPPLPRTRTRRSSSWPS